MPSVYSHTKTYPNALLESGVFHIPTDDGCHTMLEIAKANYKFWESDVLLADDMIFEFELERKWCEEEKEFDDELCNTIIKLLVGNIISKGDLSIFFHAWDDDKNLEPFYTNLYNEIEFHLPNFECFDFPVPDENGNIVNASIIINKDHPDRDKIIDEFKKIIEINNNN